MRSAGAAGLRVSLLWRCLSSPSFWFFIILCCFYTSSTNSALIRLNEQFGTHKGSDPLMGRAWRCTLVLSTQLIYVEPFKLKWNPKRFTEWYSSSSFSLTLVLFADRVGAADSVVLLTLSLMSLYDDHLQGKSFLDCRRIQWDDSAPKLRDGTRSLRRVCAKVFKVNIWSELLYSPTQPEPSETSFLSFL